MANRASNIRRQQLKEDRTKSLLMLACSMVVMALMFSPWCGRKALVAQRRRNSTTRPNAPNLGRGPPRLTPKPCRQFRGPPKRETRVRPNGVSARS